MTQGSKIKSAQQVYYQVLEDIDQMTSDHFIYLDSKSLGRLVQSKGKMEDI